jgi:hypothetical protein
VAVAPPDEPTGSLDAERILQALARQGVDYVLVGGLASALHSLDARVLNPGSEALEIDAAMLPRATLWQFSTPHGPIDVLHDAPGAPPYKDLRDRALEVSLGQIVVPVAGRDDLISMKRASGRPIDLEDLAVLTEPDE